MPKSLTREPDGNVILRSDNVAWRHFAKFGGTPLQFWREPYPLLTDPFPGCGTSLNWETGQDPTQASSNSFAEHNLCRFDDPVNTGKYNYYIRETLFDTTNCKYKVTGFYPDFWASVEDIDDAIAPNAAGGDAGWRTKYAPGNFATQLHSVGIPVIFEGKHSNPSGLFFVGNEMLPMTTPWNARLRDYGRGRFAGKFKLSLKNAFPGSFAGLLFRKSVPTSGAQNKDTAYNANGLHLFFNTQGGWALHQRTNGSETILGSGAIPAKSYSNLSSDWGMLVEVRTHNIITTLVEIYLDDVLLTTLHSPEKGPHVALFASCPGGYVTFSERRFFHLGVEADILYSALDAGTISTKMSIRRIVDEPVKLYRANSPGIFLSSSTFPVWDRTCAGKQAGKWKLIPNGVVSLNQYQSLWCGNSALTNGIEATVESCNIDKVPSAGAHALVSRQVVNDGFVMMLNPLPYSWNNNPQNFNTVNMNVRWRFVGITV